MMSHSINRNRVVQPINIWTSLWYGPLLLIFGAFFLTGCGNSGSTTHTTPTALAASVTATLAPANAPPALVQFVTPVPVRAEEPLSPDSRNIPSVFVGITEYHAVQATLQTADLLPPPAVNVAEAALAVVKILRCEAAFGCETPVGSGVIIHPNGLILTAYHVLLTDPADSLSTRYEDFVIALTANARRAPEPRYHARLIAAKADQDLAILMIDRDLTGLPVESAALTLPALPLANADNFLGSTVQVLGYPVNGGEAISSDQVNVRGYDDDGRLLLLNQPLEPGNSGGPALIDQENRLAIAGLVIRRRSTQGQLSQQGLVRAIDQLHTLTWTPRVPRAWGENVQAQMQATDAASLQLVLTLNTVDLVDQPLRLLFYATDAATDQPWRPVGMNEPLVVWADVEPLQMIARQRLTLTVPVESLGVLPDHLRFRTLLWEMKEGNALWAETDGVQAPVAIALAPTITPMASSPPTPPLSTATATPAHTPTAAETGSSLCMADLLATIPTEKTKQVTYADQDQELTFIAQGNEEVLGPFGLTLTQNDAPIGALTFEIIPDWAMADNAKVRIIAFLDGMCNSVAYDNRTRNGVLPIFNYDTIGFRLNGHSLTLRFKLARFEQGNHWVRFDFYPDLEQTVTPSSTLSPTVTATATFIPTPTTTETLISTATLTYDPRLAYNISTLVELVPNELMRLGRGAISQVAYAPDGKTLAVATALGIWLYSVDRPNQGRLLPHTHWIWSVSWSPDGSKVAAGSADKTVRIWDVTSGETLVTLQGHTGSVLGVSWSSDGSKLASASWDKTVRIWDATGGETFVTLQGHTDTVSSVSWSPDGSKVASGSADSTVRIWDAISGETLVILQGHTDSVSGISWSPIDHKVVSGSDDNTVRIWDTMSGEMLVTLQEHTSRITSVSWSSDGRKLASSSIDKTVRIWDAMSGGMLTTFQDHTDIVSSVSWSPDSSKLASASADATIRVWDARGRETLVILQGHTESVSSVSWSPDGRKLASAAASADSTVRIWDAISGGTLATLQGHMFWVWSVSWSSNGSKLASASWDNTVRIWDTMSGETLVTLQGHMDSVNSVSWLPDGSKLASASADKTVRIWDAISGETLATLQGHTNSVRSVSWSPDGRKLASGAIDKTVRIWDAISGETLATLQGHTNSVRSVSWSPDGSKLASGSDDDSVRIWDATSGALLATFQGHKSYVYSVSWSPDGSKLASASNDNSVRIWDATGEETLAILQGHTSYVYSVSWSPDGSKVASASNDGTVRIWRVE